MLDLCAVNKDGSETFGTLMKCLSRSVVNEEAVMNMKCRAFFVAALLCLLLVGESNAAGCGSVVTGRYFLAEDKFTLDRLVAYFRLMQDSKDGQEVEVFTTWTADERLDGRLLLPQKMPLETTKPLMYQFGIGKNVFFLHRGADKVVKWSVIEGENLFEREIAGAKIFYGGQSFPRQIHEAPDCPRYRNLCLVVERLGSLRSTQIQEIVAFYDGLLQYPERLDLTLFNSFEDALSRYDAFTPLLIPSYVDLEEDSRDVTIDYSRQTDGRMEIRIFRGEPMILWRQLDSLDEIGSLELPAAEMP